MNEASTCLFCRIIENSVEGNARDDAEAAIVLDEPLVLGFLDHAPVFPGHVLLVPKAHHVTLPELPTTLLTPLFEAAQRVATAVERATDAHGTWVSMNNVVSQSVPHLHVHVVPRRRKDGLRGFYWPRTKYPSADALHDMAARIRNELAAPNSNNNNSSGG